MIENSDDRLIAPASTIFILFLSLLIVIPLATVRMASSLVSPTVQIISLEDSGDRFRGQWKVGEIEYIIEEGADEARPSGTFSVTLKIPGGITISGERARRGYIEKVIFLDPDGDGTSNAFICIRSADSSGYLQMLQYDFSIDGISTTSTWSNMTEIPDHLSVGYMGRDNIERQSEMLVRSFPLYLDGENSTEPSGETRSLIWDFHEVRWRPDPRN